MGSSAASGEDGDTSATSSEPSLNWTCRFGVGPGAWLRARAHRPDRWSAAPPRPDRAGAR
eukprot:14513962-Alexandrium_andersonii.AAC.1